MTTSLEGVNTQQEKEPSCVLIPLAEFNEATSALHQFDWQVAGKQRHHMSGSNAGDFENIYRIDLEEFVENWERAAFNITGLHSTQSIEAQCSITRANKYFEGCNTKQKSAQYGRLLPQATKTVFSEFLELQPSDIFVDLGHGLGNAVMQAAYTHGCASRGIEVVKSRFDVSLAFKKRELSEMAGCFPMQLRHGQIEKAEHRHFLTMSGKSVMKVLCNNFGDVFGTRSSSNPPYLNDYVAGLFASMKEGSKIATFDELRFQVGPLDMVNKHRKKLKMETSSYASFYIMERKVLGFQNKYVSWSENGGNQHQITMYVYTRVGKESNFMCSAAICKKRINNERQKSFIINQRGEMLMRVCECKKTMRPHRLRTNKGNEMLLNATKNGNQGTNEDGNWTDGAKKRSCH